MTISGVIPAVCKECGARMVWHMDNQPFVGGEIIGTCGDCLERKDHDIFDEFEGEHGEIIGRKIFFIQSKNNHPQERDLEFEKSCREKNSQNVQKASEVKE